MASRTAGRSNEREERESGEGRGEVHMPNMTPHSGPNNPQRRRERTRGRRRREEHMTNKRANMPLQPSWRRERERENEGEGEREVRRTNM